MQGDTKQHYLDRDLSWLSFNGRVLNEAVRADVPLLERLKFLSIFSSNLDEFYRVRIPAIIALNQIHEREDKLMLLDQLQQIINDQQQLFGNTLASDIIPSLKTHNIQFVYKDAIPENIKHDTEQYFFNKIAAFIHPVRLSADADFFPENNKIYFAVIIKGDISEEIIIVNIPSDSLPRFHSIKKDGVEYVLFLDDIIRENMHFILPFDKSINGIYSFKVTRDAELDLQDEYEGDIAEKIELQIMKRDLGIATRLLFDASMPQEYTGQLLSALKLENANIVKGGRYHHLKDLESFPVKNAALCYDKWPVADYHFSQQLLLDAVSKNDILIHPPYQDYGIVLRFFNEAALDPDVEEIHITLYRIASESTIANALCSAAKNGKRVTVFVELKARFDEANNIRWAKKMQDAGVKIIYSIPGLKVHAKIALVKKRVEGQIKKLGLFATGNFNENTARFYTDHILMTANENMMDELEQVFDFLNKRKKPDIEDALSLKHLLVAQFNLQQKFLNLIEREIENAKQGYEAHIVIKMNNLEEKRMIDKLYEAADAGVKIELIIRGICRLNPNYIDNNNIVVKRIVDRYLEHGRIFIFHNKGEEEIYLGSADWMNRNIYRRIEVCFPLYKEELKWQIKKIIHLQLEDNTQSQNISNYTDDNSVPVQSQLAINEMIQLWQ